MGKVAIVTDSNACVPKELVKKYNIHIVPILLNFDQRTFRDEVDITTDEVYRRLRENKHLPTTSAPSVGDFLRVYAKLAREAEAIVSVHLPSELSAVYSTAITARSLVDGTRIEVVDCRTAAMGQGFVVLEAARAAARGCDLDEVLRRIEEIAPKINLFAAIDTFKYLYRSGRVPAVAALMGSLLQIKPIIYLKDGQTGLVEKPRTISRAMGRMVDLMGEKVGEKPVHVAIFHASAPQRAEKLKEEIASRFHCADLYITEFTPVMGVHTGPGLVGLTFWAEDAEGEV